MLVCCEDITDNLALFSQLAASAVFSFLLKLEHLLDFQGKVLKVPVLCLLPACGPMFMHQIQKCCPQFPKFTPTSSSHPVEPRPSTWMLGISSCLYFLAGYQLGIIACTSVYSLTGVSFCLCTFALSRYLVWKALTISLAELCLPPRLWTPTNNFWLIEELWHHVCNDNNPSLTLPEHLDIPSPQLIICCLEFGIGLLVVPPGTTGWLVWTLPWTYSLIYALYLGFIFWLSRLPASAD